MKKPNRRSKRTSSSPAKTDAEDHQHRKQEAVPQPDYEKRVSELEEENRSLKREVLELKEKAYNATPASSNRFPKSNSPDFHALQEQVTDLKKKVEVQYQMSMQKVINDSKGKRGPEDEIQRLKAQKVQLLCKMKLESVQFRISKASLEKEVLRLKKEQWRHKYEMRKLLALNQSQKLVLQRKTEEASTAAKRLNDILEPRKNSSKRTSGTKSDSPGTQGEFERKLATRVEDIRADYERQMEEMAEELRKYEEEAETLKEENFRLLLQDKELDCMARESELKDLKDEVIRLSHMVAQITTQKIQARIKTQQMDTISCSLSAGSHIKEKVDTSQSCGGSVAGKGKSRSVCCSCSKKSSCKTQKCECRAAGRGCGMQCGCSTAKCNNRQVPLDKTGDSVQQPEVQKLVSLGSSVGENIVTTCEPAAMKDAASETRRLVLQDVGNMQDNPAVAKPRPRTRKQKPQAQRDSADAPDKIPVQDAAPQKVKRTTRAAAADRTS